MAAKCWRCRPRPGAPCGAAAGPAAVQQVEVWDDRVAGHDQGDAVAGWLSAFLGTDCRLVRFDRSRQRPCSRKWTGDAASTFLPMATRCW
jgi:uncharacterized protein YcbX